MGILRDKSTPYESLRPPSLTAEDESREDLSHLDGANPCHETLRLTSLTTEDEGRIPKHPEVRIHAP